MNLTDEDVVKIIKLVEESNFDSLQLECGDLKLTVSKSGYAPGQPVLGQPVPSAATVSSAPRRATEEVSEQAPVQKTVSDPKASATKTAEEEGLVAIKAPMVGTFFCAPEPGAEPFVSVGSKVDEDTIVGLIEAMKVFTSVMAGVKGEIMRRLVEDSQFVEYGQTLFLVRPDDGKGR